MIKHLFYGMAITLFTVAVLTTCAALRAGPSVGQNRQEGDMWQFYDGEQWITVGHYRNGIFTLDCPERKP